MSSVNPTRHLSLSWLIVIVVFFVCGCGVLQEKPADPTLDFMKRPLTPQESEQLAGEVGGNFLYGQGFGEALISLGGIILWPPYALYALGNAGISLAGYQPLYVTNLLPEPVKSSYDTGYDVVSSGPGRFSAAIGKEEFRNQDVIRKRYRDLLEKNDSDK